MSVFSESRERSDIHEEHEKMRMHLTPEQNKDLDDSSASSNLWLRAGYASAVLMGLALLAVALS